MTGDAAVSGEKCAVHMGGQESYSAGQILQHGHRQVRMTGKDSRQPPPVNAHQLAFGHGYGGGNTGLLIKKSRFANERARPMKGKGALVAVPRADKTLYSTG